MAAASVAVEEADDEDDEEEAEEEGEMTGRCAGPMASLEAALRGLTAVAAVAALLIADPSPSMPPKWELVV